MFENVPLPTPSLPYACAPAAEVHPGADVGATVAAAGSNGAGARGLQVEEEEGADGREAVEHGSGEEMVDEEDSEQDDGSGV